MAILGAVLISEAFGGQSVFELYLKQVILNASPQYYKSGHPKVRSFTPDFVFLQHPIDDDKSQN